MDANQELNDLRSRILKANSGIRERLARGETVLQYDHEVDYLYVRFERVGPDSVVFNVDSASNNDTLSLTVEDTTMAVVGYDIRGFQSAYLTSNETAREAFQPLLDFMTSEDIVDFRIEIGNNGKLALFVPKQVEQALMAA